jgi:hypothetical protein
VAEPNAYFRQHVAVEAPIIDETEFRPYWRVHTRLDALLHDRAINFVEWRAGQAFRSIAETILAKSWPASKWLDSGARGSSGFNLSLGVRHDALGRLHKLHDKLGSFAIDLLEAHVVDDESWTSIARRYGVHPKTARTWTVIALRALAAVIWSN